MKKTKIAFLDRDGVINSKKVNNGYIGSIKDFKWNPGSKQAIKYLKSNNFKVVIVSNQSGVARGYFKLKDVRKIFKYMQIKLKDINTKFDKYYFCPYHKEGIIKKYKKNSSLRKPNIGMFRLASKIWNVDKYKSFMIGDQKTDIEFAKKAKIKGHLFKGGNLLKFTKKIIKNYEKN